MLSRSQRVAQQCGAILRRSCSRFSSQNQTSSSSNSSDSIVHLDHDDYFRNWRSETSELIGKWVRATVQAEYLESGRIPLQNYCEIGVGHGFAAGVYAPYFENTLLVEPNPLFIDYAQSRLAANYQVSNFRFANDYIENFTSHLSAAEQRSGFDLISIGHVMYHVQPRNFSSILDSVTKRLSASGMLVITMLDEYGPFYESHLPFARQLGVERLEWTANIRRYCDERNDVLAYRELADSSTVFDMDSEETENRLTYRIPMQLVAYTDTPADEPLFAEEDLRAEIRATFERLDICPKTPGRHDMRYILPQRHFLIFKK